MSYHTLISTVSLAQLNPRDTVIFDCRFSLADADAGNKAFNNGHIPHAHYVHLDNDLSSVITGSTGRHPLPDFSLFTVKLGNWGVAKSTQVVVYDDAEGAIAGRMWWLLRCLGHNNVAVLDGGIKHWKQENHELTTATPIIKPKVFRSYINNSMWLTTEQLARGLNNQEICLIDARIAQRYTGAQENIDPVSGHIPGALNRALQLNLNDEGLFLSADVLRKQFLQLIGTTDPEQVVHMCGSGVTACHNLLAMEISGLTGSRLYAGSWSEWIKDKTRPVITGTKIR